LNAFYARAGCGNVGRAESFVKKDETRRQRIEQEIDPGGPRSVVAVYVDADVTEHGPPFDLMAGFAFALPDLQTAHAGFSVTVGETGTASLRIANRIDS
jgi:hypothetical protein